MLNIVALMGRLTRDPELKKTQNDVSVVSFTLAVDRSFTPQNSTKQVDFINIVAWRQTAEFVGKYFRKGQLVAVDGSIQTRSYIDKNGNNKIAFEVVANKVHFAGAKRDVPPPVSDKDAPYVKQAQTQPAQTPTQLAQTQPTAFNTNFDEFEDLADLDDDNHLPF